MIYAFDVDGVLTDTGYNIDTDFEAWFVEWSQGKNYILITGSTFERTLEQIGERITQGASIVANCMGNCIYQSGRTIVVNEFKFSDDETEFLMSQVQNSSFKHKASNHIVLRPGSANFSVVGRDASLEQRKLYKDFDKINQERLRIAKEFKERFPRFDVFIGGDISIDICLAGANKSQLMEICESLPNNDLYFFGDKMIEWGIDRPLSKKIQSSSRGRSFHITNGYIQTRNILTHLIDNDIL